MNENETINDEIKQTSTRTEINLKTKRGKQIVTTSCITMYIHMSWLIYSDGENKNGPPPQFTMAYQWLEIQILWVALSARTLHRNSPPELSARTLHRNAPAELSAGTLRRNSPPECSAGTLRCNSPPELSAGTLRHSFGVAGFCSADKSARSYVSM